jgi:two-component system phosphate regulon sensor histidine kinase PhoR
VIGMRRIVSMRVWLSLAFLVVGLVTVAAVAAWVLPAADEEFGRLSNAAALGVATQAATRVGLADDSAEMQRVLNSAARRGQISLWLVRSDGSVVARAAIPGLDLETVPGVDEAIATAVEGRRFLPEDDADRDRVIGLAVRLPDDQPAALVAYVPPSGFGAGASDVLRRELLTGAAIAMGVAIAVGILIASVVAARTRRIAQAAEAIADGDFGGRVNDRIPDEIGSLAASIDEMRARLALAFASVREERERLRGIVDRLEEAVIAVDADGVVEFANPAALELCRPNLAAGEPFRVELGGMELVTVTRAAATQHLTFEHELVTADDRHLRVQIAPLPRHPRHAALVVVTDHTAASLREDAERRFIANASHELRTPLAAIVAAAEVLTSGAKDDPASRDAFIEDIQREAVRLSRLTDALLTLARLGSGELVPRSEAVDVGDLAQRVAGLMLPLAHAAGLSLEAQGAGVADADRDLLQQVLIGLVGNGVKHTPSGGAIELHVEAGAAEVTIEVTDTGHGIAAAELPHVFDRFWRGDASRQAGGFGLGLATAREFVSAMGGSVAVASSVGSGTAVTVTLPVARRAPGAVHPAADEVAS